MKNLFLPFLLTACFLASLPVSTVFAADTKCNLKLQGIRSSLEEKKIYIKSVDFRVNRFSPYNNANQEVMIVLNSGRFEKQRSLDFLHSGKLQLDIASQIVEDCDPVVRVVFGLDYSDFTNGYSYHKSIGVKKDECRKLQQRDQSDPAWGEEACL